jgi:hypothetical protein
MLDDANAFFTDPFPWKRDLPVLAYKLHLSAKEVGDEFTSDDERRGASFLEGKSSLLKIVFTHKLPRRSASKVNGFLLERLEGLVALPNTRKLLFLWNRWGEVNTPKEPTRLTRLADSRKTRLADSM